MRKQRPFGQFVLVVQLSLLSFVGLYMYNDYLGTTRSSVNVSFQVIEVAPDDSGAITPNPYNSPNYNEYATRNN